MEWNGYITVTNLAMANQSYCIAFVCIIIARNSSINELKMREFARSDCLRILIIQIIQPLDAKLTRWRVYPCIPFIPCDKLMAVGSICHSLTSPGMMRQGSVQTQLKLHMHFLEGGYFGCHIFFYIGMGEELCLHIYRRRAEHPFANDFGVNKRLPGC